MPIRMSKETMKEAFLRDLDRFFAHPEIASATVRDIVITRETVNEAGRRAFDAGFHDLYSDIDLSLKVRLPENGTVTPEDYLKRIDRFGVTDDAALGFMFIPIHQTYRIIFKNGMRYDLSFGFEYEGEEPLVLKPDAGEEDNADWPLENIERFWFVQVQALGKLYRKDYLISGHLANMNCNDTLVMQMIMRDKKHGTSHHRYGYAEELEYVKELGKNPYSGGDMTFGRIADRLYAAALAYDRLAKCFYPGYENRSDAFFAIWDWYDSFQ